MSVFLHFKATHFEFNHKQSAEKNDSPFVLKMLDCHDPVLTSKCDPQSRKTKWLFVKMSHLWLQPPYHITINIQYESASSSLSDLKTVLSLMIGGLIYKCKFATTVSTGKKQPLSTQDSASYQWQQTSTI